ILRSMPQDEQAIAQALIYNRSLFDQSRDLGGTRYPISAVQLERADWERHYGPEFERLAAAKRRYDPDNLLASGPDMLGKRP
ncbi:MAG: BBE domain-containing protein, partial [Roseiflexaceae bacterium]|nr:BBE domain-containing protein [Roseiflexaceae bacterium]